MLWINIKRIVKSGFVSFWRNGFVSLSSILVMVITLFVIGSIIFIIATLDASLRAIKDKVDINVYLTLNAPEEDILNLKKSIEAMAEVKFVAYISRADALANFKERHRYDDFASALNELPDNPLSAVFNISAKDPSEYEAIANFLKSDSALSIDNKGIISKVNYEDNKVAIDTLSKIITAAEKLGLALTLILAFISIIITFNTIRLTIFISKEEISVMRLVGASNKYIRGPFVISGIMYGIFSGAITLIIFYPLTYWLGTATENFFSGINIYRYYIANFGQIFGIIMGSGVVLGAISSYLAVRRYLTI